MEEFTIIDFNKFFEFGLVGVVILVLILIIGFLLHWVKTMAANTIKFQSDQIEKTTEVVSKNTVALDHVTLVVRDMERTVEKIHGQNNSSGASNTQP